MQLLNIKIDKFGMIGRTSCIFMFQYRFTGTYLGPDDAFLYNIDKSRGVMQVGNSYVLIRTSKVQGLEGKTITVEGCFYNDKIDGDVVPINNKYVYGEHFYIDNVIDN